MQATTQVRRSILFNYCLVTRITVPTLGSPATIYRVLQGPDEALASANSFERRSASEFRCPDPRLACRYLSGLRGLSRTYLHSAMAHFTALNINWKQEVPLGSVDSPLLIKETTPLRCRRLACLGVSLVCRTACHASHYVVFRLAHWGGNVCCGSFCRVLSNFRVTWQRENLSAKSQTQRVVAFALRQ